MPANRCPTCCAAPFAARGRSYRNGITPADRGGCPIAPCPVESCAASEWLAKPATRAATLFTITNTIR